MIEPFKGELMLHPCAIDYNANTCSNACAYCFAQCRKAERVSSPRALVDLCYGRSKAKGLVRQLFDAGLPINLSNRTDPLAVSNQRDSAVAFQALSNVSNGVLIQTKGARAGDIFTLLDKLQNPKTALYITITTPDNGILKRVEPGAGDYETRLALVDYARSRSWPVLIGLNPIHKEYLGSLANLDKIVHDCVERGAGDFLVQPLHISAFAAKNMREDSIARLGNPKPDGAFLFSVATRLREMEKEMQIRWQRTCFNAAPSEALTRIRKHLAPAMHSTQEFVNFAAASPRRFFTSADFLRCVNTHALDGISGSTVSGYLFCYSQSAWKDYCKATTFEKVYRAIWNDARFWPCPRNVGNKGRFVQVVDENGIPLRDKNFGDLVVVKCDAAWKAWERPTMTLAELTIKEVNVDEVNEL